MDISTIIASNSRKFEAASLALTAATILGRIHIERDSIIGDLVADIVPPHSVRAHELRRAVASAMAPDLAAAFGAAEAELRRIAG